MINTNLNLDIFKSGSALVTGLKKLVTAIKCNIKHANTNSQVTFERAAEDYFSGCTGPGAIVSIEGYLSKYVLTHRPAFYSHYAHRVKNHSISPILTDPLSNRISLEISAQPNPFPIQTIPPILSDNDKKYIYFLYQPDISSFILPIDETKKIRKGKGESLESLLDIKSNSKPIIAISPKKLDIELEKIVRITGVLRDFDENVLVKFLSEMTGSQQEILSNTIRPFAETIGGLCLDLRESSKITHLSQKNNMKSILYVESHMENIENVDGYKEVMGIAFPGAFPGLHWFGSESSSAWGLSSSEVYIATNEFSRFAYFIETDLSNPVTYKESLQKLQGFTEIFRKNVQNYIRKVKGVEVKHHYDFVFDYSKSKLFHPKGVLVSKDVESILKNNPSLQEDVEWLKKQ